jgi:hypothetical protein
VKQAFHEFKAIWDAWASILSEGVAALQRFGSAGPESAAGNGLRGVPDRIKQRHKISIFGAE